MQVSLLDLAGLGWSQAPKKQQSSPRSTTFQTPHNRPQRSPLLIPTMACSSLPHAPTCGWSLVRSRTRHCHGCHHVNCHGVYFGTRRPFQLDGSGILCQSERVPRGRCLLRLDFFPQGFKFGFFSRIGWALPAPDIGVGDSRPSRKTPHGCPAGCPQVIPIVPCERADRGTGALPSRSGTGVGVEGVCNCFAQLAPNPEP